MRTTDRDLDRAIEEILSWRASRSTPVGLLDEIREEIGMDPRQRSAAPWFATLSRPSALAWIGLLVALLAIAAAGAAFVGSRPEALPAVVAPVASPSAAAAVASVGPAATPASAASEAWVPVYCTTSRSLPFDPSRIDLTGTWTDRSVLYYLRQSGDVVWGVAPYQLAGPAAIPLTGAVVTALHGRVGPGPTVTLDWADTGAIMPTDTSAPRRAGSMVLRAEAGAGGTTQLVVTSQTGYALTGPAFGALVLTPCVPSTTP